MPVSSRTSRATPASGASVSSRISPGSSQRWVTASVHVRSRCQRPPTMIGWGPSHWWARTVSNPDICFVSSAGSPPPVPSPQPGHPRGTARSRVRPHSSMSNVDVSPASRQTPSSLLPELPHLPFGFLLLPLLHPISGPRPLVPGAPRATDDRLALAPATALRGSPALRLSHPAPFRLRHRDRSDAGMLPAPAAPGEAQTPRTGARTAHRLQRSRASRISPQVSPSLLPAGGFAVHE